MSDASRPRRRGPGPAQRQRSENTRETVVRAAIELLSEGGVEAATASAISERSGVSWGGIQHQFGNKDAVLDAALRQLVFDLSEEWAGLEPLEHAVERRVEMLVDLVWRVVTHPSYRPLLAMLRRRSERDRDTLAPEVQRLRKAATSATRSLFADLDLDQSTLDLVDAFCFAAVGGIAEQQQITPMSSAMTARARQMVAAAVLATLRRPAGRSNP